MNLLRAHSRPHLPAMSSSAPSTGVGAGFTGDPRSRPYGPGSPTCLPAGRRDSAPTAGRPGSTAVCTLSPRSLVRNAGLSHRIPKKRSPPGLRQHRPPHRLGPLITTDPRDLHEDHQEDPLHGAHQALSGVEKRWHRDLVCSQRVKGFALALQLTVAVARRSGRRWCLSSSAGTTRCP